MIELEVTFGKCSFVNNNNNNNNNQIYRKCLLGMTPGYEIGGLLQDA